MSKTLSKNSSAKGGSKWSWKYQAKLWVSAPVGNFLEISVHYHHETIIRVLVDNNSRDVAGTVAKTPDFYLRYE